MTLTEISKFGRQDQICLLVIYSKLTASNEKRLAENFFYNGRGYLSRILGIARRYGLTEIRLPAAPPADVVLEIVPPPPSPDAIRAGFAAADPDTQQFIRDAHTEGIINGLRDVTFFSSVADADAAWDALPGYTLPAEKFGVHSELFPFRPTEKI